MLLPKTYTKNIAIIKILTIRPVVYRLNKSDKLTRECIKKVTDFNDSLSRKPWMTETSCTRVETEEVSRSICLLEKEYDHKE